MTGFAKLPTARQLWIGEQVAAARANGTKWKDLEATYQRDRVTLWRYAQATGHFRTRAADRRTAACAKAAKMFQVKQKKRRSVSRETSKAATRGA